MKISNYYLTSFLIGICIMFVFSSCAKTYQAKKVEEKGFIEDYSQLHEDKEGLSNLIYINRDIDFTKFDKIWIETLTFYVFEGSDLEKASQEDLEELLEYLNKALVRELSEDYEIVDQAGPGTMQFRFAITQLSGQNRLSNTVSTYVPQARAFSTLKKLATGKHMGVGSVAYEAEMLNSLTGERLAASMGAITGGKSLGGSVTDKYSDFKAASDLWAGNLKRRLENLRAKSAEK